MKITKFKYQKGWLIYLHASQYPLLYSESEFTINKVFEYIKLADQRELNRLIDSYQDIKLASPDRIGKWYTVASELNEFKEHVLQVQQEEKANEFNNTIWEKVSKLWKNKY